MNTFKRITAKEAKDILGKPGALLFDIRHIDDYNEDHDLLATHLSNAQIAQLLEKTDKSVPILVMCYHGNNSQVAAQYLSAKGFSDVYSIDGGYEEWKNI